MKEIVYASHLEFRLKFRGITYTLPKDIYKTSQERYFDRVTKLLVATKVVRYRNKLREFALVYRENPETALLITIHPLKRYQKINRVQSGRWQKI